MRRRRLYHPSMTHLSKIKRHIKYKGNPFEGTLLHPLRRRGRFIYITGERARRNGCILFSLSAVKIDDTQVLLRTGEGRQRSRFYTLRGPLTKYLATSLR